MSVERSLRLAPAQLALKLATRDAVKAAGGQEFVANEVGRAQSRISDYGSPNTADFMPIDVVAKVEALGAGSPGHPHVTRALARAQGADFVCCTDTVVNTENSPELVRLLAAFTTESSDVMRALASGAVTPAGTVARIRDLNQAQQVVLGREIDQVIDVLAGIAGELHRCQQGLSDTDTS